MNYCRCGHLESTEAHFICVESESVYRGRFLGLAMVIHLPYYGVH